MKAIKAIVIVTAMSKKRSSVFSGKNRGMTSSVAAPGVTTLVTPLEIQAYPCEFGVPKE